MTKQLVTILAGLLFAGCAEDPTTQEVTTNSTARRGAPTVTTFASGITNPRGFTWDDDGNMYVATAGLGGEQTATDEPGCPANFNFFTPYGGGYTGEIIKIQPDGTKSVAVSGLPSMVDNTFTNFGPTDVAFVGGKLYVLIEMGGCSHGLPDSPAGIYRVNHDGSTTLVADLGTFTDTNPQNWVPTDPDGNTDLEPGGVHHSMLVFGHDIYVVETNHGQLLRFNTKNGQISRVYDYSLDSREHNPIVMTKKGNRFIVGTFGEDGPAEINSFDSGFNGYNSPYTGVFNPIVGLDYLGGDLYGMEMFPWDAQFSPDASSLVRFNKDGTHTTILANFASFTQTLKKGPDGALYTSNQAITFTGDGDGSILRIAL